MKLLFSSVSTGEGGDGWCAQLYLQHATQIPAQHDISMQKDRYCEKFANIFNNPDFTQTDIVNIENIGILCKKTVTNIMNITNISNDHHGSLCKEPLADIVN